MLPCMGLITGGDPGRCFHLYCCVLSVFFTPYSTENPKKEQKTVVICTLVKLIKIVLSRIEAVLLRDVIMETDN